jgi:putative transposase
MARAPRSFDDNSVVHVVNRGNERRRLFDRPRDYDEFLRILDVTLDKRPTRLLGYVLMPNHWHMVLWPAVAFELSQFLHYLTTLHAARFRHTSGTTGLGHVYQGRFRSTVVDSDLRYAHTLRYVEGNPVRAQIVRRAEDWPWSSLAERLGVAHRVVDGPFLLPPADEWASFVNRRNAYVRPRNLAQARKGSDPKSGWNQNGV